MERSFFRQVKEAIAGNAQATLEGLGVNFKQGLKGEWSQCLCLFCGDTSGSASITQEGFLKCHQCSRKQDVFEWYAEKYGVSPWVACQTIGDQLGVDLAFSRPRGRLPKNMTQEILRASVGALWEDDAAAPARKFLADRKLDNPQLLERFGVGFIGGYITFAQFTPTGKLRGCYRTYTIGGSPAWLWKGSTKGGTVGFWPHVIVPDDGVIWIMEGEWDALTGWDRMQLQAQGIYCVMWTGGGGGTIPPHAIPEAWWGKEIHILPDNDVYQGKPTLDEHKAPTPAALKDLGMRWRNLMDGVAPSFIAQKCKVYLRAIPIDPLEVWGADFRDWVDRGERDLAKLKPRLFNDLRPTAEAPKEANFAEVYNMAGQDVKFTARLSAISRNDLAKPATTELVCQMGTLPCCASCQAPAMFPNRLIHWKDHRNVLAVAMMKKGDDGFDNHVLRHLVGKPNACVHATLAHREYAVCSKWFSTHDEEEEASEQEITIISEDAPSMAGEMQVTGRVHHANQSFVVMADRAVELDGEVVDLSKHMHTLKSLCPYKTDKPEVIQEYLERRCADLSCNVTRVYGREPIHLAHELLVHSALWMDFEGLPRRAWMDISVMGDTRTGKTETFKRLMDHHRLGTWQSSGENMSRAGLTIGAVAKGGGSAGNYKAKPGLFPRNHKKMLVLDEFHASLSMKDDIIATLQGARDDGRIFATRVFGNKRMFAAVRLATISNWPYPKERFRWLCEHVQALYRTPEALSRMDFAIVVDDVPTERELAEVSHEWTEPLVRALALRAWGMTEGSMIHISPEATKFATQKCEEWSAIYSPHLPFFTPEEKHLTILRMAIAVANLCFSHPEGEPYSAAVNLGHAEWAADFLEKTWEWSGYDGYSYVREQKKTLAKPLDAEARFVVGLNLKDAQDVTPMIEAFLGGISAPAVAQLMGVDQSDANRWLSSMKRLEVLVLLRDTRSAYFQEYHPTKGGDTLIRNMIYCAENYPEAWSARAERIDQYSRTRSAGNLTPLTEIRGKLIDEWENRHG